MSVLISLHAASFSHFLQEIANDRQIAIARANCDQRILARVQLSGNEERPFMNQEIQKILLDYRFFKPFFLKKGLWPTVAFDDLQSEA